MPLVKLTAQCFEEMLLRNVLLLDILAVKLDGEWVS